MNILDVKGLSVRFDTLEGAYPALDNISFSIAEGKTTCIVGESGCGKSVTALSIMRLLAPNAQVSSGEVLFNGSDLLKKAPKEMLAIRGKDISMIFQEPMTSLNPVYTVGWQLSEVYSNHAKMGRQQIRESAVTMLERVGIRDAQKMMGRYPHELSGGMRQRVMIAMALALNPKLLIADEPTTALDVTIQAQVLDLIKEISEKFSTTVMLITHDMGVVADIADYVIVMYLGRIVEQADAEAIFSSPRHPYTKGLLASIPPLNEDVDSLLTIPGHVPPAGAEFSGCSFSDRCPYAKDECLRSPPSLVQTEPGRMSACHFPIGLQGGEST
ncbi:MAG: ABC transporter ATP-binding protein [Eubacteriaceae bacterium]|jgi:peptide/nickel transport system ATP-binding protein/oligopeptide transport system ATP-binding protein|nr:ABC transporter ATP-binding protein [Eubacteriaceae bacterium]